MLHNNLHKLQAINEDFHVFSMSGIKEQELLMGRRMEVVPFFINKTLGYNSIFIETENTRVCSVLLKYDTTTIIFYLCIYAKRINSNEYNYVLSSFHMLQCLYNPNFIICGGDWNTDLTRKISIFTKSLVRYCYSERLTCVNCVSNVQQFTYVSDMMNGSKSTIDHFIICNNLLNSVIHSDVRDDVDNHSDHLPITLYMYLYVPIAKIAASYIRKYLPKPNWFCADKEMLQKCQYELDQQLGSIQLNECMCNHTHENYQKNIGIQLGGMNTLAKSSIMHYIGIDCTFNMAVPNLVLSLKCEN